MYTFYVNMYGLFIDDFNFHLVARNGVLSSLVLGQMAVQVPGKTKTTKGGGRERDRERL